MFIDPEPKPLRQTSSSTNVAASVRSTSSRPSSRPASRPTSAITEVAPLNRPLRGSRSIDARASRRASGFFSSQTPRDSLRNERQRVKKRGLHDRTSSDASGNQPPRPSTSGTITSEGAVVDASSIRLSKPTIRLVGETPEPGNIAEGQEERRSSSRYSKLSEYLDEERAWREKYRQSNTPDKLRSLSDEQNQQSSPKPTSPRSPSAPGFPASRQDRALLHVSDSDLPANRVSQDAQDEDGAIQADAPTADSSSGILRHDFSSSLHPPSATEAEIKDAPHRRDNSNSTFLSDVTTLLGNDSAVLLGLGSGSDTTRSRLSGGTTLRGTPTPWDQDQSDYPEDDPLERGTASIFVPPPLSTLQEQSPDRRTVRLVSPSEKSLPSLPPDSRPATGATDSLPDIYSPTAPVSSSSSEEERFETLQPLANQSSTTQLLQGSTTGTRQDLSSPVPQPLTVRKVSASPAQRPQTGQQSVASSSNLYSSPNLVAYSPADSDRQRSVSHPLRSETSLASINSILQYPAARAASQPLHLSYSIESIGSQIRRSTEQRSIAGSSSRSSRVTVPSRSSRDTLPSLKIQKKRLRHKAKGRSYDSAASSSRSRRMDSNDYDPQQYGRHQFSTHLSTIASESERSGSRHLSSHFSLGSGILTGDDASGDWSRYRQTSAPLTSLTIGDESSSPADGASSAASPYTGTSTSDEPGDMTLGIFRAESAKPEPLRPQQGRTNPSRPSRLYDGPLPPLPPIPKGRDSEERIDTVSELSTPALREMRSGYSLRRRSNSTPSHSRQLSQISYATTDSERNSGGNVLPTWAKHFYSGTTHLLSASKISLSAPHSPPKRPGLSHSRTGSEWTERSITSRLGTGYSHIEETPSPSSSHFLPSIFRPRTRPRLMTDGVITPGSYQRSWPRSTKASSRRSNPRTDPMSIPEVPLSPEPSIAQSRPSEQQGNDVLPSGQPRWGTLRDVSTSPTARQKPSRTSNTQRHYNERDYPHNTGADRSSELPLPSTRRPLTRRSGASSYGISVWRAPSFVESLDTLLKSRGNRQILFFTLGFCCPLLWMLAAVLPLPRRPLRESGLFEKTPGQIEAGVQGGDDATAIAMRQMEVEAGGAFAERRWHEERKYLKANWWRNLNRIMSVVGLAIIAAIVALAVIATR